MKKQYTIPYYSMNESNNKKTIKKAIELLSNDYLINFAFIEDQRKIEFLETIVNLTNIYFNMNIEEGKQ